MTTQGTAELDGLQHVADWIRDEVDENGHLIRRAVGLHPAFDEGNEIASAMLRRLVLFGARGGARDVGLVPTPAYNGLDLVWSEEGVYRKYRIKKARKGRAGSYEMLVGPNSVLFQAQTDSLLGEEQWVLGYTVALTGEIDEVFAARVIGVTNHKVPQLVLGTVISLGAAPTPPTGGRFTSDNEDFLPGFEDDGANQDDAGSAA
jgi:hypothetical protein